VLELAGYLLLAASSSLSWLLVSLGVLQLGKSLQSGTFEALLWESIDEADRERDYVRVYGRINAAQLLAVAAASLLGGFLYRIDARLPFAAAGAAFGVAAVAALWLREPARGAHEEPASPAPHALADMRSVGGALARAWRLTVPLIVVGAFLAVTEEVLDDVLAVEFGFSPAGLGALVALAYLAAAAAARVAHRLEAGWGRRPLVFGVALAGAVTLVLSPRLGLLAGGAGVLLRHAFRSVHDTVVTGQLAAIAPPSQRATILSVYQAIRRLPYVAFAWSVGTLMDRITARGFALWFGVAMVAATSIAWWLSLEQRKASAAPERAGAERW
jgi:hypothetical protein